MKKRFLTILISILLILSVVSPLAAFDGGGQLDTNIALAGQNWFNDNFGGVVGLTEKATGWFRTPLPLGTLSIEANWTFNISYGVVWPLTLLDAQVFSMRNTLDVNLVKYNLPLSIADFKMDINIGRFSISDSTGLIFNQNMDGLYVSMPFKLFSVATGVGYTGLQNAKTTAVYKLPVATSASSIYEFAPGYVAILTKAAAPNILGGQSFEAEVNMFVNCNTVQPSDGAVGLHRSYATVGARGPIIPLLYYNAAFSFGFAFGSENKVGIMGKGGVTFYPNFLSSALTFTTVFATAGFLPFTDIPVSVDGKIHYSDLLNLALSYSMKPVDKWLLNAEFDMLYTSEEGTSSFILDVFQGTISAKFQCLSDFCLAASSGVVIPVDSSSVSYFTGSVRAQLSF